MPTPRSRRPLLELAQDAPPDPEAARRGRDPHALDLGGLAAVELQRAAADRLAAQSGDQEQAGGLGQLGGVGRDALAGIEAGIEAGVELGEVGLDAEPGRGAGGVLDADLDHARREQPLDDAHRIDEPLALGVAQRGQERGGEFVALAIQQLALGAAGVGESHRPHPLVGRARLDHDEPILLERAHQPAEIAGVEVQPRAQDAQVACRPRRSPTAPATPRAAARAPGTRPAARRSAGSRCG